MSSSDKALHSMNDHVYNTEEAINALLVIVSTGMIFLMQTGFAMVEAGCVRQKNAHNILIKNLFDAVAGAIAWWLLGYGFAFGQRDAKASFIGDDPKYFAASGFDVAQGDLYLQWIFQFSFAATATTIVSGSLAERTTLPAYYIFSFFSTAFIYPVVVSWVWGGGWLQAHGFIDFAGSGCVHMVGGVCGFFGAWIVGPRHGKEKDPKTHRDILKDPEYIAEKAKVADPEAFERWVLARQRESFTPHSYPFITMGTFILWVSWLFFNGGSTLSMFTPRRQGVSKIIMNTIIAGAAAGIVASVLKPAVMKTYSHRNRYDLGALCNGILCGLVAITAGCWNCEPWAAFIIGVIGGIFYSYGVKFLEFTGVDDPVEATAVHGFGGTWGIIAAGIFDNDHGLFTGTDKQNGTFFGWQWLGAVCIIAWCAVIGGGYFLILKKTGNLRVSLFDEIIGLDITEMGDDLPDVMLTKEQYQEKHGDKSGNTTNRQEHQSVELEVPDEKAP